MESMVMENKETIDFFKNSIEYIKQSHKKQHKKLSEAINVQKSQRATGMQSRRSEYTD